MTTEYYWTYSDDGERFDAEFETAEDAYAHAANLWSEKKADDPESFGEKKITLIRFHRNDELEMVDDFIKTAWV